MDYETAGVSLGGGGGGGGGGVGAEEVWGLSSVEIKVMLETCAKLEVD